MKNSGNDRNRFLCKMFWNDWDEAPSQLIKCWHYTAASKWEVLLPIIVLFWTLIANWLPRTWGFRVIHKLWSGLLRNPIAKQRRRESKQPDSIPSGNFRLIFQISLKLKKSETSQGWAWGGGQAKFGDCTDIFPFFFMMPPLIVLVTTDILLLMDNCHWDKCHPDSCIVL